MATLTRHLANNIVAWDDIRALKAKKLVALDKCPGVRPIVIGDVADRLCAKIDDDLFWYKSVIEESSHAF